MAQEILFTKQLSSTDVTCRLAVPTRLLNEHFHILQGSRETSIEVRDSSDKTWDFTLSIRSNNPNRRPVLIGDWLGFVRSKDLKEGDRITVYVQQHESDASTYSIRAERNMFRLLGADIWVDVDEI